MPGQGLSPVIRQMAATRFLLQLQFWFPIWVVYLLDRNITLLEIVVADILYNIAVTTFEFPLGMVGDWLGRRRSYFLGALVGAMTFVVLLAVNSFLMLVVCWVVWAAYIALLSGTDSAYLYELVVDEDLDREATRIFGKFGAVTSAAFLLSHLLAGLLYELSPLLPIIINATCFFMACTIILTLPDPRTIAERPSAREIIGTTAEYCRSNTISRNAILLLTILIVYHWTTTLIFQPFLQEVGIPVALFGLVFVTYTGFGIIGGLASGEVSERVGETPTVLTGFLLLVFSIGLIGWVPGIWAALGFVTLRFAFFLAEPVLKVILNRQLKSSHRASLLSFANVLVSIGLVFSRPFVGWVSEEMGNQTSFFYWAIIGVFCIPVVVYLLRRLDGHARQPEREDGRIDLEELPKRM